VVDELAVTHAIAATRLEQQVGSVRHRFEPAREDDARVAGEDLVAGEHHGFHAGSAHLVHGRGRHTGRHAGRQRCLSRRCLAEAGRQHAAKNSFVERGGVDARVRQRRPCGNRPELGRLDRGQDALESTNRRPSGGRNDQ
jgi:hypothetical protein